MFVLILFIEGSDLLITGAADNTARLWDVQAGKERASLLTDTAVRCVEFSECGAGQVIVVTDAKMGQPAKLMIFSTNDLSSMLAFVLFRHQPLS